uniref:Uncharacterized protein n=1 Tax=Schistocephalus solidus TaxID=70667 RepID=A0A183T9A5_SCHSO
LDRTLYARTTSKQAVDNSIFWAEEFDLKSYTTASDANREEHQRIECLRESSSKIGCT